MLKKTKTKKPAAKTGGHYAIIASSYNAKYVDSRLAAAEKSLGAGGARSIQVVRVPGAYEIPLIAAKLAHCETHRPDAIICLGVIIQGATAHADHIGEAITMALTQLQLEFHVPIIHEVLLVDREADAKKRCLDPKFNKGIEAAHCAMEMVEVLHQLNC
jgi:6,7-dimethyl-8-ribityllumazine synthase